jgi:hypothetical protein
MKTMRTWLFRALVAFHVAVVASMLIALPAAILWPRTQPYIVIGIVIAAASWVVWQGNCPLTLWERRLRELLQRPVLSDDFTTHHLHRLSGIRISRRAHTIFHYSYLVTIVAVIILL